THLTTPPKPTMLLAPPAPGRQAPRRITEHIRGSSSVGRARASQSAAGVSQGSEGTGKRPEAESGGPSRMSPDGGETDSPCEKSETDPDPVEAALARAIELAAAAQQWSTVETLS